MAGSILCYLFQCACFRLHQRSLLYVSAMKHLYYAMPKCILKMSSLLSSRCCLCRWMLKLKRYLIQISTTEAVFVGAYFIELIRLTHLQCESLLFRSPCLSCACRLLSAICLSVFPTSHLENYARYVRISSHL